MNTNSRAAKRRPGSLLALIVSTACVVVPLLAASETATAATGPIALHGTVAYTGRDGVALRNAPTATAKIQPLIVWMDGHDAPIICQDWSSDGSAVGPNSSRVFDKVSFSGYGGDTWVPDAYVNGTAPVANQFASNIPRCGSSSPAPAPSGDTRIWVGAPFHGQWVPINSDCYASSTFPSSCSRPSVHHWLSSNAAPYGDWAVDMGAPVGTGVVLYAAPQVASLPVTATVDRIAPACSTGNPADGGYAVTVAFSSNGTRVGSATYGHIQPAAGLAVGQTINRWGTTVGTVGSYGWGNCWQGAHLHFQLYSQRNYACYNRGWADKQWMNPSNFIGFTGGNVASGPRQPCA